MMYGKKRISLTNGDVVLAGGKTYHPIGRYYFNVITQEYIGWFLKNEHQWERNRTKDNCIAFSCNKIPEIRKIVLAEYPYQP